MLFGVRQMLEKVVLVMTERAMYGAGCCIGGC